MWCFSNVIVVQCNNRNGGLLIHSRSNGLMLVNLWTRNHGKNALWSDKMDSKLYHAYSFKYLGSSITTGGVVRRITSRTAKANAIFVNLWQLWRYYEVHLPLKGRTYNATVRSILLRLQGLASPCWGFPANFCIWPLYHCSCVWGGEIRWALTRCVVECGWRPSSSDRDNCSTLSSVAWPGTELTCSLRTFSCSFLCTL